MTIPEREGETTVDLTPGEEIAEQRYRRWWTMPNRDAYTGSMMREIGREAFEVGHLAASSLTAVDLTPGPEDIATASLRTKITGNQRWMTKAMAEMADQLVKMAEALEALELDVETGRAAAYRAGQEDASREVAKPIEKHDLLMADRVADVLASAAKGIWYVPPPWTGGFHEHVAKWLAQVAEQIVAGLAATPEQQGALSLAQAYLTWRDDQVNQPRTPSGCDGEDSPEERTDG